MFYVRFYRNAKRAREFFEKSPLSEAGKHPDFQVTSCLHFDSTNVDYRTNGLFVINVTLRGKSPDRIARETYHSLQSVDRYLGQFDRVRHCLHQGFSAVETARILDCSLSLVETYLQMDKELVGEYA